MPLATNTNLKLILITRPFVYTLFPNHVNFMLDLGSVLPPAVVVVAGRVEVVVLGILFHHLHTSTPPHTRTVMITTRAMTPPVTPPAIAATDANNCVCVCV